MIIENISSTALAGVAKKHLRPAEIVLDIGCGIKPQKIITPKVHICLEPCAEYRDHLQRIIRQEYDREYVLIKGRWQEITEIFPPKSVDTIFLTDVVEHLEKNEALRLIAESEKIARSQIAIFTVLGFLPQNHPDGKDAWGLSGGTWQEHKSGWGPEDFDDSWDIFISPKFHDCNHHGQKLEHPFGAFWAIKNFPVSPKNNLTLRARHYGEALKYLGQRAIRKFKHLIKR